MKDLGTNRQKFAVAGLYPHASECGLFGTEELDQITPAIELASSEGIDIHGPIPPDTVFHCMNKKEFDLVIALYHDQGHIPLKLIGFDSGVNITVGLPIIRTSVDHGTAYEIAGKSEVDESSLLAATEMANKISERCKCD